MVVSCEYLHKISTFREHYPIHLVIDLDLILLLEINLQDSKLPGRNMNLVGDRV